MYIQNDNKITRLKDALEKLKHSIEGVNKNTLIYRDIKQLIEKGENELKKLESLKEID